MSSLLIRPLDESSDRDLDTAYRVVRACEEGVSGRSDATRDSVTAQLTGPDAVVGAHRLVLDGEHAVGLLAVEHAAASVDVFVDAYSFGPRAGEIERMLLAEGEQVARSVDGARTMSAGAYGNDEVYRAALADAGLHEVRRFWRMHQDLSGVGPEEPAAPPGASRVVARTPDERIALHAMREITFAEHFGHETRSFEDYWAVHEAAAGRDPDGWWLVLLDGEPVGLCILDDSHAEFGEGHVRTLGIVPEARGRGIARWLLACAAAYAVRRGRTALTLTVDGENTTGATALYTSVGFEVREVIDVWEKSLLD